MQPISFKKEEQSSTLQSPLQTVSLEAAQQMMDGAAQRALEKITQNLPAREEETVQEENMGQQSQEDFSGGDIILNSKTQNSLVTTLLKRTLDNALNPPQDPIRNAFEQGISQLATDFVTQKLGGGGNVARSAKSNFINDILNSQMAYGLGQGIGSRVPETIETLRRVIGQEKTQQLADSIIQQTGSQEKIQSQPQPDSGRSDIEKQKDMIRALDPNNSEHISQYATAMAISSKLAKDFLIAHQGDIDRERGNIVDRKSVNDVFNTPPVNKNSDFDMPKTTNDFDLFEEDNRLTNPVNNPPINTTNNDALADIAKTFNLLVSKMTNMETQMSTVQGKLGEMTNMETQIKTLQNKLDDVKNNPLPKYPAVALPEINADKWEEDIHGNIIERKADEFNIPNKPIIEKVEEVSKIEAELIKDQVETESIEKKVEDMLGMTENISEIEEKIKDKAEKTQELFDINNKPIVIEDVKQTEDNADKVKEKKKSTWKRKLDKMEDVK